MPGLVGLLALGYIVCAQVGARMGPPWLATLAVGCLAAAALLPALWRGSAPALLAALLAAALLGAALAAGAPRLPGYFVPPLLLALASAFFARTLRAASRPLIARIVEALDGADFAAQATVQRYARGLTLAWACWLAGLGVFCLILALLVVPDGLLALAGARPPLRLDAARWSLWVNLAGYGGVAVAFAGEFAVRRLLIPQAPRRPFVEFARRVAALWPELRQP
jgi:uncharacterized membrane protein